MEGVCFNDEGKHLSSFHSAVIKPKGFHPSPAAGSENEIMRKREKVREKKTMN